MLGFSLKEGEFAVIGDAIVRLTQIKHGHAAQLAVCVAEGVPVTRLDAFGEVVNCNIRVSAIRWPADDPAVDAGCVLLVLSCGHEVLITQFSLVEYQRLGIQVIDCADCRRRAGELKSRVKANFNALGPSGAKCLARPVSTTEGTKSTEVRG